MDAYESNEESRCAFPQRCPPLWFGAISLLMLTGMTSQIEGFRDFLLGRAVMILGLRAFSMLQAQGSY